MSYSITIQCETFERFIEIMENMTEIAKKKEDKKKNDKRSDLMRELHRRTKEFHEQNSLIDYKTCLSIIADQIKEEKDIKDAKDIILDSVIDILDSTDEVCMRSQMRSDVIDILDSVIDISNVDV